MSYMSVRIHAELLQRVKARKAEWQSTTQMINDLLASALDNTLTASGHPQRGEVLPLSNKEENETA